MRPIVNTANSIARFDISYEKNAKSRIVSEV